METQSAGPSASRTKLAAPDIHEEGLPPLPVVATTVIRGLRLRIDSLTTVVRTVKILAIHMSCFDQDMVINLMRCFPCLEKLYAKEKSESWETDSWNWRDWNPVTSLDIRLRTIVLRCYVRTISQVNFGRFFVLNARMLESMRLEVESRNYNEDFFAEQHEMLQMEKRASRGARLCFTTGCHHDVSGIMHVDDLDLTDPFACGCGRLWVWHLWSELFLPSSFPVLAEVVDQFSCVCVPV